MATKIRIKVGNVEVDYEGPEAFLNKKLPELISQLSNYSEKVPDQGDSGGGAGAGSGVRKPGTLASFLMRIPADRDH